MKREGQPHSAFDAAMQQITGIRPVPAKVWGGAGDLPPDEVHAYGSSDGHHWLYVTWGLSGLWADSEADNDSDDDEPTFELTVRVARDARDAAPPEWPVSLLENLCRYVATTGHAFDAGHLMHLRGPLALDRPTQLVAVAFVVDPRLGERLVEPLAPPVTFLQLVALTDDEYRAARRWSVERLSELFAADNPFAIVDLGRGSRLDDKKTQKAVDVGSRRDGSSTSELFLAEADWKRGGDGRIRLKLGAASALTLSELLSARLPFGRPLLVVSARSGKRARILFEAGAEAAAAEMDDAAGLRITLDPAALAEWIKILQPRRARHELVAPPCTVEIIKSEIRDRDGRVVEVVE